jgi:hypothetical protein
MKSVQDMTRKELLAVQPLDWDEPVDKCDWVVIIPMSKAHGLHDSGYRCMTYVFGRHDGWMRRGGGGSDVLHIGGISDWLYASPVGWSIDCLPGSGCLRLFNAGGGQDNLCSDMTSLSSVEIKTQDQKKAGEDRMKAFRSKQ